MDKDTPVRRRWFQFSLATMFVVASLFGVMIGFVVYSLRWAAERESFLIDTVPPGAMSNEPLPGGRPFVSPWPLRIVALIDNLIGGPKDWRREGATHGFRSLGFNDQSPEEQLQRARALFPEATILRIGSAMDLPAK